MENSNKDGYEVLTALRELELRRRKQNQLTVVMNDRQTAEMAQQAEREFNWLKEVQKAKEGKELEKLYNKLYCDEGLAEEFKVPFPKRK